MENNIIYIKSYFHDKSFGFLFQPNYYPQPFPIDKIWNHHC